jgi:hypothetical protein
MKSEGGNALLAAVQRVDWELVCCAASALMFAALSTANALDFRPFAAAAGDEWWAAALGLAALPAILAAWIKAILDGRLPARPGGEPRHAHISGWSFLLIALAVSIIIGLATWAATGGEQTKETIDSEWGIVIVFGLALAFTAAAISPGLNLVQRTSGFTRAVGGLIAPFGRLLSIFDSVLVFVVAGSAGATRENTWLRYLMLAAVLIPCGALGYTMEAPWGLIPIGWGFLVAISMSRRWAWIEDDRELAMLNRKFAGSHLRIGFKQDMRDEALLSFMSMFFLIPLALRQAQITALDNTFPLFSVNREDAENLWLWISFFGTELAKAVPFVDWAEIYHVGGSDDNIVQSPAAQHFVFGTRILVDLVFLAALLQALAISARNSKQRELFYGGTLDRLDPFIEPQEFKNLVSRLEGKWQAVEARVKAFPRYDRVRVAELLSDSQQPGYMRVAADALRKEQGGATSTELHAELLDRATKLRDGGENVSREDVMQVVLSIRAAGAERDINKLDETRLKLNGVARAIDLRSQIIRLVIDAPNGPARTRALMNALVGPNQDYLGQVRALAIAGLSDAAANDEPGVLAAIRDRATSEAATVREKQEANALLRRLGKA